MPITKGKLVLIVKKIDYITYEKDKKFQNFNSSKKIIIKKIRYKLNMVATRLSKQLY